MPDPYVLNPSLHAIAAAAEKEWKENKEGSHKLVPLYIKSHNYKRSCPHKE